MHGDRRVEAIDVDRPDQLLRPEVGRHLDREHAAAPAWIEVRRLAEIGAAWLYLVVGTDRNVNGLFHVAVEIPEQERDAPVGVLVPTFVHRVDALAALPDRL